MRTHSTCRHILSRSVFIVLAVLSLTACGKTAPSAPTYHLLFQDDIHWTYGDYTELALNPALVRHHEDRYIRDDLGWTVLDDDDRATFLSETAKKVGEANLTTAWYWHGHGLGVGGAALNENTNPDDADGTDEAWDYAANPQGPPVPCHGIAMDGGHLLHTDLPAGGAGHTYRFAFANTCWGANDPWRSAIITYLTAGGPVQTVYMGYTAKASIIWSGMFAADFYKECNGKRSVTDAAANAHATMDAIGVFLKPVPQIFGDGTITIDNTP